MKSHKKYLLPKDVSQMLSISVASLSALVDSGEIRCNVTEVGQQKFLVEDVIHYACCHEIKVNAPKRSGYRVLIVDDDEAFSRMLVRWFDSMPYEIEIDVASNGFQAGYKARQKSPDLILLDVMMSGVSGIDVVEALKEEVETSHIRIIGMTGAATKSRIKRMVNVGAEKVLQKPFDISDLVAAIREDELAQFSRAVNV
ncbi:MAG: response regulator [Acidiferrobacterales bacterium]